MKPMNKTLAGNVAASIREDILAGVLEPGAALRQDMLADRYAVSSIPVREALRQLEAQGLVTVSAHRGGFVRGMSEAEADEIFFLRRQIEPDLVARAVAAAATDAFKEAERLFKEMNDELTRNGPTAAFGDLHWRFHRAIYSPSGREQSISLLDRLYIQSERYIRLHLRSKIRAPRSKKEHKTLLDACLAGRSREAAKLVRAHIEGTADDLKKSFGK